MERSYSLPDIEGRCNRVNDLIWRSDAIKAITDEPTDAHYPSWYVDKLKEVPPVEKKVVIKMDAVATGITFMPNKSVGKWEERSVFEDSIQQWQSARCSVCEKYHTTPYLYYFDNFTYCPNCGARMVVEE